MRTHAQRILDESRSRIIAEASTKLSSFARAMVLRKSFKKKKVAVITLQKCQQKKQKQKKSKLINELIKIKHRFQSYFTEKRVFKEKTSCCHHSKL